MSLSFPFFKDLLGVLAIFALLSIMLPAGTCGILTPSCVAGHMLIRGRQGEKGDRHSQSWVICMSQSPENLARNGSSANNNSECSQSPCYVLAPF